jgi:hypothetical protein
MRPRSTSGQAAVEYIAVVALVAIVFVVVGSFVLNGRAIAAATVAQIRRGLCIVEGHDCADPHEPCSVSSHGSGTDLHVDVVVVRLSGGSSAIIDRRSDGKVAVTVTDHLDAGASAGLGGGLKIGGRIAVGGELRAAALASLGHGATYEVANERQATALLRLLRRPKVDPNFYTPAVRAYWRRVEAVLPRIPAPSSRYRQIEGRASLSAELIGVDAVAGERDDAVTGKWTYYLEGTLSLEGGAVADASAKGRLAVTLDREGRPVDLAVLAAGELNASVDLPVALQSVAGHLTAGTGRTWELEGHLDLTQPGRPPVRSLLSQPARLLRMVLAEGSVQVRVYGASDGNVGLEGHLAAGLKLGGGIAHTTSSRRLLAAMDHTREGFWVPRFDCVSAA